MPVQPLGAGRRRGRSSWSARRCPAGRPGRRACGRRGPRRSRRAANWSSTRRYGACVTPSRTSASASAGPATSSSRSYSRCGSSTPANANVVSPTRSVRAGVGQVEPAGVGERPRAARATAAAGVSCCAGRRRAAGSAAGCAAWARSSRWSRTRRRPGTSSRAPSASRTTGTESRWAEVVAGVDHQVGAQRGQPAHPVLLARLAGGQVQVGEVQHPQRPVPGRQQRHRHPAQGEGACLGDGVRREPSRPRGGTRRPPATAAPRLRRVTGATGRNHAARLPQWRDMSALKDRLRADLTTA